MSRHLVVVVGPTAVGKTAVGVALAQHLQTSVLSADSRQFYKEMSIGTAKPTRTEQQGVPHFFIDSHAVGNPLSAGEYEREALSILDSLFTRHDAICLVGGSGLFVDAVCRGLDDLPQPASGVREKLNLWFNTDGLQPLLQRLKEVDPEYVNQVDSSNPQRIIRALEVFESTGQPFSHFRKQQQSPRTFDVIKIGLELPRDVLYERINQRVLNMMDDGLLEEVQGLIAFRHLPVCQTVGYTELFAHLEGVYSLDEAIARIQQNSRRYAKRQLTWFRKDHTTQWFAPDDLDGIIKYLSVKGVKILS